MLAKRFSDHEAEFPEHIWTQLRALSGVHRPPVDRAGASQHNAPQFPAQSSTEGGASASSRKSESGAPQSAALTGAQEKLVDEARQFGRWGVFS
jgi:hypothetical protein